MTESGTGPGSTRWAAAVWLTLAAAVCAAVLAMTWSLTETRIEENVAARAREALMRILPDMAFDNDPLTDVVDVVEPTLLGTTEPVRIHRVRRDGRLIAAIFAPVAPDGYVGPIDLLIAVMTDGRVSGVAVVAHTETPGLGDRIEPGKSNWLRQFDGRSLDAPPEAGWRVRRDGGEFDQITGATITTRTIVNAVRDTLIYFGEHASSIGAENAVDTP